MINLTFSIIPNPHTRPDINFLDIHHHTIHAVIMRIFRPCFSGIYPKQTMQNEPKICKHICDAVWIIVKINGNSTVLWFSHALWRKHQKFVLRDLCAVKQVDHFLVVQPCALHQYCGKGFLLWCHHDVAPTLLTWALCFAEICIVPFIRNPLSLQDATRPALSRGNAINTVLYTLSYLNAEMA